MILSPGRCAVGGRRLCGGIIRRRRLIAPMNNNSSFLVRHVASSTTTTTTTITSGPTHFSKRNNNNNRGGGVLAMNTDDDRITGYRHGQQQQRRRRQQRQQQVRYWSTKKSSSPSASSRENVESPPSTGERLRVAVVGGGCAGLTAALQLAPLVERGFVASPVDVFDCGVRNRGKGRDIGVGLWSTALECFEYSDRESHRLVYDEVTKHHCTYVSRVGYRVPGGRWLMTSELPSDRDGRDGMNLPSLFFLRERDMLMSLQKAAHWEEQYRNTIRVHRDGDKTRVIGIDEMSPLPWSSRLVLNQRAPAPPEEGGKPTNLMTERDYHLVIAADGVHSILRRTYGGHDDTNQSVLTAGAAALPSPLDLPDRQRPQSPDSSSGGPASDDDVASPSSSTTTASPGDNSHHHLIQQESVGLQDREYTVFRGNSLLTSEQMIEGDEQNPENISFQTWGEGHSMRFATVPMTIPGGGGNGNGSNGASKQQQQQQQQQRQVWFITTDDEDIASERDAGKRRQMLLDKFESWHDPICKVVRNTPADEILMERAIAHRHCMGPVWDMNRTLCQLRGIRPPNSGHGPCMVFTGDAFMTVDPILAQGFTRAMEGAHALRRAVQNSCVRYNDSDPQSTPYAFDPYLLREELQSRHDARIHRLLCLLRATELVQALGQPRGGTMAGLVNVGLLRPLLSRAIPNFIKAPLFDAVLKYSLGLPMWGPGGSGSGGRGFDEIVTPGNDDDDDEKKNGDDDATSTSSSMTSTTTTTNDGEQKQQRQEQK